MLPTLRYFDGIPFVATPYQSGAYIRQDVFMNQFILTCMGEFEYPQDDPQNGTYKLEGYVLLGSFGLIEEAISMAQTRISKDPFPVSAESHALAFYPEQVYINFKYSTGKLVLSGTVRHQQINWCYPPESSSEEADLEIRIADLNSKASFESGWDNYETARTLWRKAAVLEGHLVNPQWRKHALAALNSLTT